MNRIKFIALVAGLVAIVTCPLALASIPLVYSDAGSALLNVTFFIALFAIAAAIVSGERRSSS